MDETTPTAWRRVPVARQLLAVVVASRTRFVLALARQQGAFKVAGLYC